MRTKQEVYKSGKGGTTAGSRTQGGKGKGKGEGQWAVRSRTVLYWCNVLYWQASDPVSIRTAVVLFEESAICTDWLFPRPSGSGMLSRSYDWMLVAGRSYAVAVLILYLTTCTGQPRRKDKETVSSICAFQPSWSTPTNVHLEPAMPTISLYSGRRCWVQ